MRPPHPPTRMDKRAEVISMSRLMEGAIWYRTDIGASFCHVSRIRPDTSGMPWVTSGTQKWNGESPSFMMRADVIMMDAVGLKIFVIVHWLENIRLMIIAIMRSIDAVACVRKYLVAASMARGLNFFIRMGIMANRFISKPIQIINQCELVITIIVPIIAVVRIVEKTIGFISTGRV